MPKFSVIIPAYNCEKTIEDTVKSVSASGLVSFEILIVDDGSTDGTASICDSLAAKNECVKCVHQANAGVSAARNAGIKAAQGEYLMFVDSDDAVDAEKLAHVIKKVEADGSIDMAIFGMSFDYYHNGKLYRQDEILPPAECVLSNSECNEMLYEMFERNCMSSLCNRIVKRSVLENNSLFLREDMFLYEDLEFSLKILKHCKNVLLCPQAVYHYRQAEGGSNAGGRLKRIAHISEVVDKIEEALKSLGSENKKILSSLYLTLAREKISVSESEAIQLICSDYKAWVDAHELLPIIKDSEYAMMIYNGETTKLICRREYTKLRHSAANWIKQNIGDFRKWKFQ